MKKNKRFQIKVSASETAYLRIKARAETLGLTSASYLRMLANQDLFFSNQKTSEGRILPELMQASQACAPQVVVIKEEKKKRVNMPAKKKKTVPKEAIWRCL